MTDAPEKEGNVLDLKLALAKGVEKDKAVTWDLSRA